MASSYGVNEQGFRVRYAGLGRIVEVGRLRIGVFEPA